LAHDLQSLCLPASQLHCLLTLPLRAQNRRITVGSRHVDAGGALPFAVQDQRALAALRFGLIRE
jgi:hypothetical protein